MNSASWIEQMRDVTVLGVAPFLGLLVQSRGRKLAISCPACAAPRRHTKRRDKRLAANLYDGGRRWHCFQCESSGDALDAVSYHLHGLPFRSLLSFQRAEVRGECERWVLVMPPQTYASSVVAERVEPVGPRQFEYPPEQQVHELLNKCEPVTDDREISDYLVSRGIDPVEAHTRGLFLALPRNAGPLNDWARYGSASWTGSGHRLIVPLYDSQGVLRSVIARLVRVAVEGEAKSVAPRGYERGGLVMADANGRDLLRIGNAAGVPPQQGDKITVIIREGEIDFAETSTKTVRCSADEYVCVLGVFAGGFTEAIGARIQVGAHVICATDADAAGDEYARRIREMLKPGVKYTRPGEAA